ncbi:MAG: DUF1015 family protein [Thermoplasmata archaeon]
MDQIRGFKGIGYSSDLNPLDPYLTLPFDEITPERRREYLRRSRYNFSRIILPSRREDPLDLIRSFISDGIFREDENENIYPYEQEFIHGKRVYRRRGFIGILNLDYARDHVHPHEKIFMEPKIQRLRILERTGFDLEPIFLLYRDGNKNCFNLERENIIAWGEEPEGVINRLYSSNSSIDCDPGDLVIADGHHRFSAAVDYYRNRGTGGWIMAAFVNIDQDSLIILPSYKLVKDANLDMERMEEYFEMEIIEDITERNYPLMCNGGRFYSLRLKERNDLPFAFIFEKIIMEKVIKMEINMDNVKTFRRIEDMKCGPRDAAFIFNPPSPEDVWRYALKGLIMPQKSTYFFPKITSGLRIFKKY